MARRKIKHFCGWMTDTLEERFWSRVEKTDGCWLWTWGRDEDGYGTMRFNYTAHRAHRLSWELAHGKPVPAGMFVCHHCDNPPCVNPAHLFLGTAKDNTLDMASKRRGSFNGARNPKAVLQPEQVLEIRKLVAVGAPRQAIADRFGVSTCSVNDIHKRRSWRHL